MEAGERVDVISIRQRQALGLGHAVLTAKPIVGDEPFAVLLGDDIIDSDTPVVGDMIDIFHRHKKAVVSLLNIPNKDTRRYGVCSGEWLGKSSQTHEDSYIKNLLYRTISPILCAFKIWLRNHTLDWLQFMMAVTTESLADMCCLRKFLTS